MKKYNRNTDKSIRKKSKANGQLYNVNDDLNQSLNLTTNSESNVNEAITGRE